MKRVLVTQEQKQKAKQLEAEGKMRKEIALALNVAGSTVTRILGAVRNYRGRRVIS